MSQTATGTKTRVQLRREGQFVVPHGNLESYDPGTGHFGVLFDFQKPGDQPYSFTPIPPVAGSVVSMDALPEFEDQFGQTWFLVR